jgi:Protein of unknown function (DUF2490)
MNIASIRKFFLVQCLFFNIFCTELKAQKTIIHDVPSWTGIFASYRLGKNWGVVGDFLVNRNNLYSDPGFIWLKGGPAYWSSNSPHFFSAGFALLRNPRTDLTNATHTLEYRIDPQVVSWKPVGKGTFLYRFRLDFRSRQNVENNELLNTRNMSYRFRYLVSYNFPITKSKNPLSLVLVNEVLIQFGNKIVYNTFDQARVFVGISQRLTKELSFDFGYFPIYSQTAAGNVYTLNHIIRLLVYTDFVKKKGLPRPIHHEDMGEE